MPCTLSSLLPFSKHVASVPLPGQGIPLLALSSHRVYGRYGVAQSRTRLKRLSSGSSTGRGLRLAAPPPSPVRGRAPAYSFCGRWVRVPEATHQPPHELLPAVVGA